MSAGSELVVGLLALDRARCTRGQLVQAFVSWLNELDCARLVPDSPVRGFAFHLAEAAGWPDDLRLELESQALNGNASPAMDAVTRATLLGLRPPGEISQWLLAYDGRSHPSRSFEPAPRDRRYELGTEIARGGLGRIVEARDLDLDRDIAVKELLDGASREVVERFVREARIMARLDHPNIVPVHDFGVAEAAEGRKRLFLCMKRVKGRDLASILRAMAAGDTEVQRSWPRTRLLGVFQAVCQGMAYAHSRGVIHRDLKPANVMVGDYGETYVVDWGLAKRIGEAEPVRGAGERRAEGWDRADITSLTLVGQVIGTPAYMPPEQAQGKLDEVDECSDVYSLGAILYAILTWHAPVSSGGSLSVLEQVIAGAIQPPAERVEAIRASGKPAPEPVPAELDAICRKALHSKKGDRTESARALHDDVRAFVEGVRERERRAAEARERCVAGRQQLERFRSLVAERCGMLQRSEVTVARAGMAAEERKLAWSQENRLEAIQEEWVDAWSRASLEFGRALAADPDCADALDGRCELILERLLEAERERNRPEEMIQRRALAQADRDGRFRKKLEAPGRLKIRCLAYACGCLKPVDSPDWDVAYDPKCLLPFREGLLRPELPLQDSDRPVPALQTRPDGKRWGHTGACERKEVAGVEVWLARYEEREKRLLPGAERLLGIAPIEADLAPGSWRLTLRPPADSGLAPVVVPILMPRGESWTQDVTLYRIEDVPPGFVPVPGGPFVFGGLHAGGNREVPEMTDDVFVARFSVTAGEYLEFLNDLARGGRRAEAILRQPRDTPGPLWRLRDGLFELPDSPYGGSGRVWEPAWPVFGVSWSDSLAYAAWRSTRDRRVYRLLHEFEFEKAARGVDARIFSWGNRFDPSFGHTGVSESTHAGPRPVGSYPLDESPYGVRDMCGCISTWCFNAGYVPYRGSRSVRGGSWSAGYQRCRVGSKGGTLDGTVSYTVGLRLAASARAW